MKKIAVIGGGASGICCAVEAARHCNNAEITIYEAAARIGKKILVTGNGRCNLTNMNCSKENYHGSPDYAEGIINAFPPESNIAFFNSLGLYTKTDECGRVYPMSGQAASVVDIFLNALEKYGIKTVCDCRITKITKKGKGFMLNKSEYADCVVIAAGGMVPLNKTDKCNAYELLKSLGHEITHLQPSLVQLECDDKSLKALKGIRVDTVLSLICGNKTVKTEEGELLFTDYGLSGIVSMQISSYLPAPITAEKIRVRADFIPKMSFEALCQAVEKTAKNMPKLPAEDILCGFLPKRVGRTVVHACVNDTSIKSSQLSQKMIKALCSKAKGYEFVVTGTRDFSFAQVTAGGAKTNEFKDNTESVKIKGLFCCGEVLDVNGDCGGYNLQWAFSSGRMAGVSAAGYVSERQK